MKTFSLFLLVFPLIESLKLPLQFATEVKKCDQGSAFKKVGCFYDGFIVRTLVNFGPVDNPAVRYLVYFKLDTASWDTWVVNKNTEFKDLTGKSDRTWQDVFDSSIHPLNYTPNITDFLLLTKNRGYVDGKSLLLNAYRNHQLEFLPSDNDDEIRVPMDVYFADEYRTDDSKGMHQGMLALGFSNESEDDIFGNSLEPKDMNNTFLYKFLEVYPNSFPLMSFDIGWNKGEQEYSCFGLGEPLPIKHTLGKPAIDLDSLSNWVVPIVYVQIEFSNRKRIRIEPNTEYRTEDKKKVIYLNTTGKKEFSASLDTGASSIWIPEYIFEQLTENKRNRLNNNFKCSQYKKVLPTITIGFKTESIVIPQTKLYGKLVKGYCYTMIRMLKNLKIRSDFIFGLPFFASTYVEMGWSDTRNIDDWQHMNFRVAISNK